MSHHLSTQACVIVADFLFCFSFWLRGWIFPGSSSPKECFRLETPVRITRFLTASRRGQDKWGRRRSAVNPHDLSRENMTTYDNMWRNVRAQNKIWQDVGNLWTCCKNRVCPDPVRKPVIIVADFLRCRSVWLRGVVFGVFFMFELF